jgi:hypothetical protein
MDVHNWRTGVYPQISLSKINKMARWQIAVTSRQLLRAMELESKQPHYQREQMLWLEIQATVTLVSEETLEAGDIRHRTLPLIKRPRLVPPPPPPKSRKSPCRS